MDEEASEAAYCLLAMSRAAEREPAFSTRALGHPTVMEQQVSSSTAVDIPAALSPPETRNAAVVALESPFMIARILTDLTRVRQDLFNVQPMQQPLPSKPSNQRNTSTFLTHMQL